MGLTMISLLCRASDGRAGAWSPTGSMVQPRYRHTATLLATGEVLVAGGRDVNVGGPPLATTEIYDPIRGSFRAGGMMLYPRDAHTATRLPSGRVLVVGSDSVISAAIAELYDPATGQWTPTGSLTTSRAGGHTATLLSSGLVLVTGGGDVAGNLWLSSAEVYDERTGQFTPVGPMQVGRQAHAATLLGSGEVLIAGGGTAQDPGCTARAELYEPATGTFVVTGSMAYGRCPGSVRLANGRVLHFGGAFGITPNVVAEL
jgi:hypothetical protein